VSDLNDLYFGSKTAALPLLDSVGLVDGVIDQTASDDLLRHELGDLDEKKKIDSRQHKRFQLNENAFALVRSLHTEPLKIYGKSMGCIGCAVFNAKPAKLGKIDNISMGGLMFHHVDGKTQHRKALVLDILMADCGFYLAGIPFKTITDTVVPDDIPVNLLAMRQVRLQFQNLNVDQQDQLEKFIFSHGAEIGEIDAQD
jgi:hypothetical protein